MTTAKKRNSGIKDPKIQTYKSGGSGQNTKQKDKNAKKNAKHNERANKNLSKDLDKGRKTKKMSTKVKKNRTVRM